ncbi:MAG: hypothetical protein M3Q81_01435 [bacterium]|nr:hypothetical protein [bacterium]
MTEYSRPGRVSSRIARKEQKKIMRQTILAIGAAIILLLSFVFVVMPNFIRIVGGLGGSGQLTQDDVLPPQIPVLAAPPTATFSAELQLAGYGEAETELVLLLNASEFTREKLGDDGQFSVMVPLNEGENTISAYAVDDAGNESNVGRNYRVNRDSTAPKIIVDEPQPGQQIELRRNQLITVRGLTEENARVTLNGRLVFADADGAFSSTYQLNEGENKLLFVAVDQAGNTSTQELTVTFRL